jgi:hypothetical protein
MMRQQQISPNILCFSADFLKGVQRYQDLFYLLGAAATE